MPPNDWLFYFITDSTLTKQGIIADVEAAIHGGAKVIQYREKTLSYESKIEEASLLAAICKSNKVDFIVNDDIQLARIVDAGGVHLGPHDTTLKEARQNFSGIIGVSCNTPEEILAAENGGADYVAVGPIFHTDTKPDIRTILGPSGLQELRRHTRLPIIAIGGIKLENVREVILAGADCACAISATVDVPDVEASVAEFQRIIMESKGV